jgi:hypothetical protein
VRRRPQGGDEVFRRPKAAFGGVLTKPGTPAPRRPNGTSQPVAANRRVELRPGSRCPSHDDGRGVSPRRVGACLAQPPSPVIDLRLERVHSPKGKERRVAHPTVAPTCNCAKSLERWQPTFDQRCGPCQPRRDRLSAERSRCRESCDDGRVGFVQQWWDPASEPAGSDVGSADQCDEVGHPKRAWNLCHRDHPVGCCPRQPAREQQEGRP